MCTNTHFWKQSLFYVETLLHVSMCQSACPSLVWLVFPTLIVFTCSPCVYIVCVSVCLVPFRLVNPKAVLSSGLESLLCLEFLVVSLCILNSLLFRFIFCFWLFDDIFLISQWFCFYFHHLMCLIFFPCKSDSLFVLLKINTLLI